ncbi:MAG: YncE family protein [Thermoplasmata archaeon]
MSLNAALPSSSSSSATRLDPAATEWSVADTLAVFNNSLIPGNYVNIASGTIQDTDAIVYDNVSGNLYAISYEGTVSVISDTANEVIHQFLPPTIAYLNSLAFDYKDNEVFLSRTGSPGTVDVYSAATNTFVKAVTVGDDPVGMAYDSALGEVFVANDQSANVSVISTSTNSVVDTVALPGDSPYALAYDPGTSEVYAANYETSYTTYGNVTVISDATNSIVKVIKVGFDPDVLVYDPVTSQIFVGSFYDYGSLGDRSNVSIIDDSTNTVVGTVDEGVGPEAMAYDPAQHEIFVTDVTKNESVISDVTDLVVATVPLVSTGRGAAYDPAKSEVWVLNGIPLYASAISDGTDILGSPVWIGFDSRYLAYDSAHQEEFILDDTSAQVAVVSDITHHVVAMVPDEHAYQAVYDRGKGEVWTSSSGPPGITVINDTTNTVVANFTIPGEGPNGMAYDPVQGEIFVGGAAGGGINNVTVINDTTYAVVGQIPHIGYYPWSLVYDRGKGEVFVSSQPGSDEKENFTVINATTDAVVTEFNLGATAFGMVYDSAKGEIFTANYGSPNISVISDVDNKIVAEIPTGIFSWSVAYDAADDEIFVGSFNDAAETVTVISDVTNTVVGSIYPVGYTPTGLAFDPVSRELYAADSADGFLAIITPEIPAHYPVTFSESGLPSGTSWSVTFNSTLGSSITSSIGFTALDGSYTFTVGTVPGYNAAPASGPLTVSGGPATQAVVFSAKPPPTFLVTFVESGLSPGTDWTVTLVVTPLSSSITSISASVENGSYSFTVGAVSGYTSNVSAGTVVVNGADRTVEIGFTATSPPPPLGGGSSGLTGTELYTLIGLILLALMVIVAFLVIFRLKKFPLVFVESGLPEGTQWSVTVDPDNHVGSSPESEIQISVSNGIYTFRIGPVGGFVATPTQGEIEVTRGRRTVYIKFAPRGPPT